MDEVGKVIVGQDWPKEVSDKNMHFRFPLGTTGVYVYSHKVWHEMKTQNLDGLVRLSLVMPMAVAHFVSVKLFGKSKVW